MSTIGRYFIYVVVAVGAAVLAGNLLQWLIAVTVFAAALLLHDWARDLDDLRKLLDKIDANERMVSHLERRLAGAQRSLHDFSRERACWYDAMHEMVERCVPAEQQDIAETMRDNAMRASLRAKPGACWRANVAAKIEESAR